MNSYGKISIIETQMHHFAEYHEDDPLKDTIEICQQCHAKESWRLGQISKKL